MLDDMPPLRLETEADTQAAEAVLSDETQRCMPSLFISHGAPTIAIEPGLTGAAWERIGNAISDFFGEPKAIVVMSPHWSGRHQAVSSGLQRPIIHDFNGFPQALFDLDYPSPGLPSLAEQIQTMLLVQGFACQLDE